MVAIQQAVLVKADLVIVVLLDMDNKIPVIVIAGDYQTTKVWNKLKIPVAVEETPILLPIPALVPILAAAQREAAVMVKSV